MKKPYGIRYWSYKHGGLKPSDPAKGLEGVKQLVFDPDSMPHKLKQLGLLVGKAAKYRIVILFYLR